MRQKERNKSVDFVANTFGYVCVCVFVYVVCFWSPDVETQQKEEEK